MQNLPVVIARPLTSDRFCDLEALFAEKGCSFARGCWCMAYRELGTPTPPAGTSLADFRKANLRRSSETVPSPGLVGYDATDRPVGWVAVGPREAFCKLQRSPVMKPVDDRPVWSVVCFVVPSAGRGRGVASALLRHAIRYARDHDASVLEAYPIDKPERSPGQWLWHGAKTMYDRAGFREVARRKPYRPVVRIELGARDDAS